MVQKTASGISLKPADRILFVNSNAHDFFETTIFDDKGELTLKARIFNAEGYVKLLQDEAYFAVLLSQFKNRKLTKVHIEKGQVLNPKTGRMENYGSLLQAVDKNVFIAILKDLAKKGYAIDKKKIRTLEQELTAEKILEALPTYTTTIQGQTVTINSRDALNFIQTRGVSVNINAKKFFGIEKRMFIVALKNFVKDAKLKSNIMWDEETKQFLSDVLTDDIVDAYALSNFKASQPEENVPLHPELEQYILKNIPSDYTNLEKALFIYLKLTRLLSYDAEFYAEHQSDQVNKKHADRKRISQITPTKNTDVVCYEVNQIYAQMLEKFNIPYCVNYVLGQYGKGHANLDFCCDGFVVNADAVRTILGSDFLTTKINCGLSGLEVKNTNGETKKRFEAHLSKVYRHIEAVEPSKYAQEESVERWKELFDAVQDRKKTVSIKDKVEIFTKISTTSVLPQTEKIAYYTKIYNQLFGGNQDTFMTIVSHKKLGSKSFRKPTLVITYNEKQPILKEEGNKYLLMEGNSWREVSIEELQEMFYSGELDFINDNRIPGIFSKHEKGTIV